MMSMNLAFDVGVCSSMIFEAELLMAARLSARPNVEGQFIAESSCLRSDAKRQGSQQAGNQAADAIAHVRSLRTVICMLACSKVAAHA